MSLLKTETQEGVLCRITIKKSVARQSRLEIAAGECNLSCTCLSCYCIMRVTPQPSFISQKGKNIMLFAPKEQGQGLVEYAIILSLVALIVIAVLWLLGPEVGETYSTIASSVP